MKLKQKAQHDQDVVANSSTAAPFSVADDADQHSIEKVMGLQRP